jgi:hypothetical protein
MTRDTAGKMTEAQRAWLALLATGPQPDITPGSLWRAKRACEKRGWAQYRERGRSTGVHGWHITEAGRALLEGGKQSHG